MLISWTKRRTTYATLQDLIQGVVANGQSLRSRTGADRSVAYDRLTHPVSQSGLTSSRPKTLQSARNIMQTRGQEVGEFEMSYDEKMNEEAKILALKSIMPERGRSFNLYADLRTAVINCLMTKCQCQ